MKVLYFWFFLFFFYFVSVLHSQDSNYKSLVQIGIGSVVKHKEGMSHLAISHPHFYHLSFAKVSDSVSFWKKRFNFPDTGITLLHQRFHNPILGNVTGLNYFNNYYLLNRNSKFQINVQFGMGIGFSDQPFDFETNNQNNAMTTHLLISQSLKTQLAYNELYKHFGINFGIAFTHFSNASFVSPNNGINTIFTYAGFSFNAKKDKILYPKRQKDKILLDKEKWEFVLNFRLGAHEVYPKIGTKPVFAGSVYLTKKIRPLANIQGGIEIFNSLASKEYANFRKLAGYSHSDKTPDHKQIGVFVGYEHRFEKLSIDGQLGFYAYDPLKMNKPYYEKFSAKYNWKNEKFKTGLGIKVHNFKAEASMLLFEYKLN